MQTKIVHEPEGEIHRPNCKERESVNFHHYSNEEKVQNYFQYSHNKLGVEQVDGFVFPWIFIIKIEKVEDIFH